MHLQRATRADYPAVVELANLAYRGSQGSSGWTSESSYIQGPRLTEPQLCKYLDAKPEAHLLVLREDDAGRLLGTVWLEPKPSSAWYLGLLTIRPEQQKHQLGRRLLAAAEAYAVDRGAQRILLTVINIRATLIAWYERRGYVRTGESEPFPYGDDRFGKPLRQDLSFIVLEKALEPADLVMHRASA
jgi:ribosomal protein S18 acetylase RimI-like enzyme